MKTLGLSPGLLRAALGGVACLLALLVYFYGLDSQQIPKNGDEYPYSHITRLTAASGKLLPLQSTLDQMRNTKPPLLFWQGILATDWGQEWTLWRLRYPSVIYTLLTALLVALLGRKVSGRIETGLLAALTYLAFFSTYRFGRPFITDPALVFWLLLPFFTLLYWRPASFASKLMVPTLIGLQLGVGLLYKSFALALPICLALAAWYLQERGYRWLDFLRRDSWKIVMVGVMSLLLFALWFVLDPDPAAVWREFVVGENVGKFDAKQTSYLVKLLWGSSSIWSLVLATLANGGLLIFPLAGLFWPAFRDRRQMPQAQRLLWLCVLAFFVVFSLPSQRSGRYLLTVMPMVALLLVLDWEKISRKLFVTTLACCGLLVGATLYLSLRLQTQFGAVLLYPWHHWLLLIVLIVLVLVGIRSPAYTRPLSVAAALLVNLLFASFMTPLDGPLGNYPAATLAQIKGQQVWVPCNFRAKDEGHRFILPGADLHSYQTALNLDLATLAARYPLFAVQLPLAASSPAAVLAACPDCRVLGERLEMRGRQTGQEIRAGLLGGELMPLLFKKELLISSPHAASDAARRWEADACR